jgi:hypothetical protein
VGLFEGAKYCAKGVFRPTENSRMRALGFPWHIVNERRADVVFASYAPNAVTAVTVSGKLAAGGEATVPQGNDVHASNNGGTFTMAASGPANANFDLQLFRWNGAQWVLVAETSQAGSNDKLSYMGSGGYYYGAIKATSGSGVYTVRYDFPR